MATPEPPPRDAAADATRTPLRRGVRRAGLAVAWLMVVASGSSCGGASTTPPAPAPGGAKVAELNTALASPWGLAFLPDGRMLVTEKAGRLRRLSADGRTIEAEIAGVPRVVAAGQGGLMDVVIDPQFASQPWVYLSYSEPGTGSDAGRTGTAVARGRLVGNELQALQVIYRQVPKVSGNGHFGSRLAFAPDGSLFVSLGERQLGSPAQDLATTLGKVVRIRPDGSLPPDDPPLGPGSRPEIWSYGHRNPQGLAIHPDTGELWLTEHGPQGGDELNRVQRAGNHGWPLVSYGCPYGSPVGDGCRIGGGTHAPAYVEPVSYWVPTSTAPSGLMFYTGSGFPEWRGNAFVGALAGQTLWRLVLDGGREVSRDQPLGSALKDRVRFVRQGPDGWIYLLTDSGRLLRIDR
ncbi:MAG: PQQ-dependent sugar dehydrogenase [Vitreoscilla sp.]|nr:PQQ-dependent sugar dehydrogenase [Vitreoscilla sp.]